MRKGISLILAVMVTIVTTGVMVFHFALDWTWVNSLYFVMTTITTVGYGDINLMNAPPYLKIFDIFLMLSGAALLTATFGVTADYLLESRLKELFGKKRKRMKGHIILCGLGNVGFRAFEHLARLGKKVVVIERDEKGKFVNTVQAMGVPVIIGDIRLPGTLEEAGAHDAECVAALSDDDLANLEAVLNARAMKKDIRVVLRMFDHNLAVKVQAAFGIQAAFSASAIAGPVFAMASVDSSVIGSFYVGEDLMLTLSVTVNDGSKLSGITTADLAMRSDIALISVEDSKTGLRRMGSAESIPINAGDILVAAVKAESTDILHELNKPMPHP
jgi:Trk K+ transport system NAD-binding subunit